MRIFRLRDYKVSSWMHGTEEINRWKSTYTQLFLSSLSFESRTGVEFSFHCEQKRMCIRNGGQFIVFIGKRLSYTVPKDEKEYKCTKVSHANAKKLINQESNYLVVFVCNDSEHRMSFISLLSYLSLCVCVCLKYMSYFNFIWTFFWSRNEIPQFCFSTRGWNPLDRK